MKKLLLMILLLAPLQACASKQALTLGNAKDSEQAKALVPFCDGAKKSWGEPVPNDPIRTQAQKAAYNATGRQLCRWK